MPELTPSQIAAIRARWQAYAETARAPGTPSPLALSEMRLRMHESVEDIPALLAHVDAQADEIARLRAALAALTPRMDTSAWGQPYVDKYIEADADRPGMRYCTYCGDGWATDAPERHAGNCPISRARALLSAHE